MGGTFRDIKATARAKVHSTMQVEALYLVANPDYVSPGDTPTEDPYIETPVNVRVHSGKIALGDMKGTNFHFAERTEENPSIIFLVSEIAAPERNAIVSVVAGEAYRIDYVEPTDNLTVTAKCLRLNASEAADLPVPETE